MNVFDLKAQVTLDTSEYKKGLKDAEKQSESSAKKIEKDFDKTSTATTAQLKSIQTQYNDLVKSSGSVLSDLDNLVSNGIISKTQYSQEYAQELKKFKAQEQEVIVRAKEMGIAFENGKFKIVSALQEQKKAAKQVNEEQKKASEEQIQQYKNVANAIITIGTNFGILGPIATASGKAIGEAATSAGGVWAKIADIILKIIGLMKQLVSQSIEYSSQVYELAQAYGASTEEISELQYIASQTGTSVDNITSAMTQLERKAVNEGEVFNELGLSVKNVDGSFKSMKELMFDTIGALSEMDSEAEKSAYMVQLFGRTTMESGEFFRLTADEIDNLRQQSEDLGITMSESTAKFGADYKRQMEALKLQGQSALAAILAGEDGGEEKLQNWLDNVTELLEKYTPTFVSFAVRLVIQAAIGIIKAAPAVVVELVNVVLDVVFGINWFQVGIDLAKAILEGFLNILVSTLNTLFRWVGVKIPKVDLGVGENLFSQNDVTTEYEISERMQQDITVKVEASGDTAVSKESAEKTAEALAPYIDKILGGK